jgi:hypothetical protein
VAPVGAGGAAVGVVGGTTAGTVVNTNSSSSSNNINNKGDVAIHVGSAGVAARGGKGTPNWRPAPTLGAVAGSSGPVDDDDDKYRRRGGLFHSLFGRPAGARGLSRAQGLTLFVVMAIIALILVSYFHSRGPPPPTAG